MSGFLGDISDWMFGQPNNPANAAQPYLNQIPGMMQGYMNPYINAGNWALPQLQNQYSQLTNNPGGFINQMGTNFQKSPGYQFQYNQALNGINNAAAAGGMAGSPQEQQQMATVASGLANQDYYNWMNHAMGAYGQGLNGLQGMYQGGMQSANNLSTNLAQSLMSQANLAYAGAANQNEMQQGQNGAVLGFGGDLLGDLFGHGNSGQSGNSGASSGGWLSKIPWGTIGTFLGGLL